MAAPKAAGHPTVCPICHVTLDNRDKLKNMQKYRCPYCHYMITYITPVQEARTKRLVKGLVKKMSDIDIKKAIALLKGGM